jgi:ABC-2 type transport system permease protein
MKPLSSVASAIRDLSVGVSEEVRQLWRDPSLLVILLVLPVLYSATVYWLYSQESVVDCPVSVIDQDGSMKAHRLTWLIDATEEARVVDRVSSPEAAFTRLRHHEAAAAVLVPHGFEERLLRGEQARIKLWIDSANMLTYGTAYAGIRGAVSVLDDEVTEGSLQSKGLSLRQARQRTSPIEVSERLLFHPTGSYGGFIAPALFMMALQQAILLACAISFGSHRERLCRLGAWERPSYARMLGRLMVHLPFHLVSAAVLVLMIQTFYPFPVAHGAGLATLMAVFVVVTGLLGLFVSLSFTNGRSPMQVLLLASAPLFIASGYTWPIEQMPAWVQWIVRGVPITPVHAGLRTVVMKTNELSGLSGALASLVTLGALYFVLGALAVAVARRLSRPRPAPLVAVAE